MSVTGSEAAADRDSEARRAEQQQPPPQAAKRRRLPPRPSSKKRPRDVDNSIEGHQPASSLPSNELPEDQSQRIQAHIATSEAVASSSALPDINAAPPIHVSSHTDRFGTFFTSNWKTSFLLTVAPHDPWRGSEVYAEVPSQGGQPIDSSVMSIPIDPPSGHELVRIDGPIPLWFHSKPSKIKIEMDPKEEEFSPMASASASTSIGATEMPPPPEETYASGELAVASAQQFALEHGYKLIIASSLVFGAHKHRRWYLRCHESAERVATTQKCDSEGGADEGEVGESDIESGDPHASCSSSLHARCKFAVTVRPSNGRWRVEVTHSTHEGHGKDANLLATEAKRLTQDEKILVDRLYAQDSNVRPASIFNLLNGKRRELSKLPLVSSKPITQYLRALRTQRKTHSSKEMTTDGRLCPVQSDSTKLFRSLSPSLPSHLPSPTSLEDRCASDFRSSLTQHLGRSLLRLGQDHDTRISAAAQLYVSSISPSDCGGFVDQTASASGSSEEDTAPRYGMTRQLRCKLCQQQGHNRRTCPQRSSSQLEDVDEEKQRQGTLRSTSPHLSFPFIASRITAWAATTLSMYHRFISRAHLHLYHLSRSLQ